MHFIKKIIDKRWGPYEHSFINLKLLLNKYKMAMKNIYKVMLSVKK